MTTPLAIPNSAVSGVKSNHIQCFSCGRFGHTYNEGTCEKHNGSADRSAAHWKDWRKVSNNKFYSLDALFPQQYSLSLSQSRISAVEVPENPSQERVEILALDWSSEGFGVADTDVPTEYLFDGGATDAVSNDQSLLMNYQQLPFPIPIKTATDDCDAVIVGKGQVAVDAEDGGTAVIEDVYFCPKANTTIISPGALIKRGAKMKILDNNDFVITLKDGKRIHALHKNKRSFIKSKKEAVQRCVSVSSVNHRVYPRSHSVCAMNLSYVLSKLWHGRLGHVSMRRIKTLFRKSEEYSLPDIKHCDVTCEDCYRCKSTRTRTLGSTNRAPTILEVLVTDVAGPFTPCLTGEQLKVTFWDVKLTYSEICIIKHKSEVHQRLVNIIRKWERCTGLKIKTVQSDRGGEYISHALDHWLKESGISHKFSNPHEPEQNGNAERLNRTLGEMARTLLASSKLPNKFWNFAYMTAAYLHNRLPNSVTGDVTPYEIFHNREPNLDILRTFGAVAFVHIHHGQRAAGKLEDRGRRCVMIGYVEGGKGWLFYNEKSSAVFPSAIANFPYESGDEHASQATKTTSSKSLNHILNDEVPRKGSIEHVLNALKLGEFSDEI